MQKESNYNCVTGEGGIAEIEMSRCIFKNTHNAVFLQHNVCDFYFPRKSSV